MKKLTHFETKKETKTVEVESQVEVVDGYQAEDGRVFVDEASCLKHEKEVAEEARFLSVPHSYVNAQDLFDDAYEETQIAIVLPRTQDEIKIICDMCGDIDEAWLCCGQATAIVFSCGGYWHERDLVAGTHIAKRGKEHFDAPDYAYRIGDPDSYFGAIVRGVCAEWERTKKELGEAAAL